jgi:ATP-binding cassette subfamily B protein
MGRDAANTPHPGGEGPPRRAGGARSLREVRELARYLRPYKGTFAAALLALFASSLLALALPYAAGGLIDSALRGQTMAGPAPWQGGVNAVAGVLAAALAAQAVCSFLQGWWFAEAGTRALSDLRRDTYNRLVRLPMAFFAGRRVGELSSRLAADLGQIQDVLTTVVPQLLRQAGLLCGGGVLMALTSGRLALVTAASVSPLAGAAAAYSRRIRRVARVAQDRLAESGVVVEETLQGIATVKAFTNEAYEVRRYATTLRASLAAALRGAFHKEGFMASVLFGMSAATALVLWYGARLVQAGDLSAGELARFMLYAVFVGAAMSSLADLYGQVQRALGATERVRELLREVPEVQATAAPPPPPAPGRRLRGEVVFDAVTFSYPSRKGVAVLRGLALTARPGERVALVGPSGAGKSTAVALLLRFYDPDGGRVLIDGRDAREHDRHGLRRQLAVVPQDVLLFGGTIAENIAYGRPGASEAEVIEAARKANADGFIRSFPQGYQTAVGERGVQLSGGQRQRVAIARAILRDPAILVLDEATSSLDSESESLVHQALEGLMVGRTSVIIAHRLATVRRADRIFVVKDGTVVEAGTHAELLDREHGVYRLLTELQVELR